MKATATVRICGTFNAWKVAQPTDPTTMIHERRVSLGIQGDAQNGYSLVMSPEGFFTADSWHETIEDAMNAAHRIFDVPPEAWRETNHG